MRKWVSAIVLFVVAASSIAAHAKPTFLFRPPSQAKVIGKTPGSSTQYPGQSPSADPDGSPTGPTLVYRGPGYNVSKSPYKVRISLAAAHRDGREIFTPTTFQNASDCSTEGDHYHPDFTFHSFHGGLAFHPEKEGIYQYVFHCSRFGTPLIYSQIEYTVVP